ncbi:monocarboxylate transporter 7 isoform X2 [Callorhinchus milii]|uniref:monocarboxylate transporter 7 isoform X2 n=1 Tax=Callorhinchus milii TaxID=7868 RepID=UPI001C3FBE97|nr:monocarboxylate transporter 7 isoform X2 [Callorhinchus milii]
MVKKSGKMTMFMGKARGGTTANVYTKSPDGGWGWAVAIAFFIIEAFTFGIIKMFGVFFTDLMSYFEESNSRVSWIVSISVFVMTFTSPLSTVLINRFGHRPVVMLGGLLTSLGMVTASFASRIEELYIGIGIVSGLGCSFSFLPGVTILSQYFEKRRSLILALASTGECFAVFIFAPAFTSLKNNLGWRNCFLILGALQLNIVVSGALLRPLIIVESAKKKTPDGVKETKYMLVSEETNALTNSGAEPLSTSHNNLHQNKQPIISDELHKEDLQIVQEVPKPQAQPRPPLLDFSILKNVGFIFYALFGLFVTFGFFAPQLYVIPLTLSQGIEEGAEYMLSAMAISELCGRISTGWILNKQPIRKIYIVLIYTIILSVVLLCFPFARGFWSLLTCSIFYGLMFGTVAGSHISVIAEDDVVGIEKMSSALGIYMCIQSFSGLAGPPIGGFLVDITGQNYGSAFFACGTGTGIGAICLSLVRFSKKRCRKQQVQENPKDDQDLTKDYLDT